jgi:hypothetical protein
MDEYYLYFLIPLSLYGGCAQTDGVFSTLLLGKGIGNIINKPAAGWISDALERHQHLTLLASCIGLLLTGAVFLFTGHLVSIPVLVAYYIFHQFTLALNENSTWKCIKFRVQLLYGEHDTEQQEKTTGLIGTVGEIFSNIYETVWLAIAWVVSEHQSFDHARWVMLMSCLVAYCGCTLISLTITRKNFYSKGEAWSASSSLLPDDEEEGDRTLLLSDKKSTVQDEEFGYQPQRTGISRILYNIFNFFRAACRALWESKMALHTIVMSLALYTFNELFEYPITFAEANGASSGSGSDSTGGSTGNYCDGTLQSMTQEAMLDNTSYTGGAIIYLLFLVRMPSIIFFRLTFPLVALVTIILSLPLLFFFDDLSSNSAYIITSIVLVIPYYLERYLLYFWSAIVDEKHYGFFYGTYSLGQQFVHLATSRLLANTDNLTSSSPLFTILLSICGVLIGIDYVYTLWMSYAYRTYFEQKGSAAPVHH